MTRPSYAFIPCRAGSQRVPHKNTRPLPGYPGGLLERKLRQISESELLAGVVLSTDDPVCMSIARDLAPSLAKPIEILDRPCELAIADTLDAFVAYVPTIMPEGDVVWMHVTSPFFGAEQMDLAVAAYRAATEKGEASLMGVTRVQSFLWDEQGCISHDRKVDKWPQTQDLRCFYEVNSSIFIIDRDVMQRERDRITDNPILHTVDRHCAFDVDWPDDFAFVERVLALEGGKN
jgi:CMP-N-acetylneuraminic acid synthetase